MPQQPSASSPRSLRIIAAGVLALGAVMIVLVLRHTPGVNGSWYWWWPWRRLAVVPYYPLMLLAAAPVIAAMALGEWRARIRVRVPAAVLVAMMMLGVFAMKLISAAVLDRPMSLQPIGETIEDPSTTSYYTDAAGINAANPSGYAWLAAYAEILRVPQLNLHTRSKPPGPVTFFVMMIRAGSRGGVSGVNRSTAIAAGVLLGALATLSIPATWWLARTLTGDDSVAIRAAGLIALCPGFVLLFPIFDPIYIVFTAALLGTSHLAMTRGRAAWSIGTGLALAVTTFVSYTPLVLGAFLLADAQLLTPVTVAARLRRLINHGLIASLSCLVAYFVLWLLTGYDPIATFRQAYANQHALLAAHAADRPYPWTILFDLTDFALGSGWVVAALAICCAVHAPRSRLVWMCLGLPVLVAGTGILQSETARVWNFMLPMLAPPAAMELGRWPRAVRFAAYLVLLGVLLVIGQNMRFL